MKEFQNITTKEIQTVGVKSLPDRPNAHSRYGSGAMTAAQLKDAFDALAELIAKRVNGLFESLKDGSFTGAVRLPEDMGEFTLYDFLAWFASGEISNRLYVNYPGSGKKTLHTAFVMASQDINKKCASINIVGNSDDGFRLAIYNGSGTLIGEEIPIFVGEENLAESAKKYIADKIITNINDYGSGTVKPFVENSTQVAINHATTLDEKTNKRVDAVEKDTVKSVTYDPHTGVLTFHPLVGDAKHIDLPLELIVESGEYDAENNKIVLKLAAPDAAPIEIPVDDLIREVISMPTAAAADVGKVAVVTGENKYELKRPAEEKYASEGLIYTRNRDYCDVSLGSCDYSNVVIPDRYLGLPVRTVSGPPSDGTKYASVSLPDGLTTINVRAFKGCTAMSGITLPKSVTAIMGLHAFADCGDLTITILYDEGVVRLRTAQALTNTNVTVRVPKQWLAEYRIATNWAEIADKIVGYETEQSVASLREALKDAVVVNGELRPASQGLDYELMADGSSYRVVGMGTCGDINVVVPRKYNGLPVTAIADNAFAGESIDSVNLWETVTSIGDGAFKDCTPLRFVYLYSTTPVALGTDVFPDAVLGYFVPLHNVEDYKADDEWAKYNNEGQTKITAIETPESINTTIVNVVNLLSQVDKGLSDDLSKDVNNLAAVDAELQRQINELKPKYSEGLAYEVVLLDNVPGFCVTGMGTCTDTELKIPPTHNGFPVLSIKEDAFKSAMLESVVIPESIKKIGKGAFDYITHPDVLEGKTASVKCLATIPPAAEIGYLFLFYGASTVSVPYESIDAYKAAAGWSSRASSLQYIESMTSLRAEINTINSKLDSFINVAEVGA